MLHHAYSDGIRNAVARAIVNRDSHYLATVLFRAGMFAGHTANTPVETAENEYCDWIASGYGNSWEAPTLPYRWVALRESLSEYVTFIDAEWFTRDRWDMVYDLALNISYLGCVKASFTLGILGYDVACLDTHALIDIAGMTYPEKERFNARTRIKAYKTDNGRCKALALYRETHDRLFPTDARNTQWDTFAALVPYFASTGHFPVYRALGVA